MTNINDRQHRSILQRIARRVMLERGLQPDFTLRAVAGAPVPYSSDDLEMLAQHCTDKEDAARKVERQIAKSAAA